jgi:hypothetical protein
MVTINGQPLEFRLDLYNHCPEFDWGCSCEGAAQLALAILAENLSDDEQALEFHQRFKWEVVIPFPHKHWVLTTPEIDQALQNIRRREKPGVWV